MIEPKKVPILSADDICRNTYWNDRGQKCLSQWVTTCGGNFDFRNALARKLLVNLRIAGLEPRTTSPSIPTINDHGRNSKQKLAAVWNRTVKELGFTEPCDRD